MVRYGMEWYGMVRYGIVRCGMVQKYGVWFHVVWYGTVECGVWYSITGQETSNDCNSDRAPTNTQNTNTG